MLDLSTRWPAEPDFQGAVIDHPGLSVRRVHGLDQLLVSGDLDAWHRGMGVEENQFAPITAAGARTYTVRVARDRVLAVSIAPFETPAGWHEEGFAVTRVGSALAVFEVHGTDLAKLLERATSLDAKGSFRSAAITFAGIHAIAYRKDDGLRVHTDRALAAFTVQWMKGSVERWLAE